MYQVNIIFVLNLTAVEDFCIILHICRVPGAYGF